MKKITLITFAFFLCITLIGQTDTIRFYGIGSSSFSNDLANMIEENIEANSSIEVEWEKSSYVRMDKWAKGEASYQEFKDLYMPIIRNGNYDFVVIQTISWSGMFPFEHDSLFVNYMVDLKAEIEDAGAEIILYDKYPSPSCLPDYLYSSNLIHIKAAKMSGIEKIGWSGTPSEVLTYHPVFDSLLLFYNLTGHPGAMQNYMAALNISYHMTGILPTESVYMNIPNTSGYSEDVVLAMQYSSDPDEVAFYNAHKDRIGGGRLQLTKWEADTLQLEAYNNLHYWDSVLQESLINEAAYSKISDTIEYYYTRRGDFENFDPKDLGGELQVERCRESPSGFTYQQILDAIDSTKLFSDRVEMYARQFLDEAGYEQLKQDFYNDWFNYNGKFRDDIFYNLWLQIIAERGNDTTQNLVKLERLEDQNEVFLEMLSLRAEKLLMERITETQKNEMISTFTWSGLLTQYAPNFGAAQTSNVSLWSEVEVVRDMYLDIWKSNDLMDSLRDYEYPVSPWITVDNLFQQEFSTFVVGYRTISASASNGTISVTPDQVNYAVGTNVSFTAVPDPNYFFVKWQGDASGSINPFTVTINENLSLSAVFKSLENIIDNDDSEVSLWGSPITRNDIVNMYGADVYKVRTDPGMKVRYSPNLTDAEGEYEVYAWIPNQGVTSAAYVISYGSDYDTVYINQTATNGDWVLIGNYNLSVGDYIDVDGPLSNGRPYADAVKFKKVITASTSFSLTINAENGSVNASPSQSLYAEGTVVSLTANPNAGYAFTSWSGDATGTDNPLSITMNANKNITANFTQNTYTVTFNVSDGTNPLEDAVVSFNSTTVNSNASGIAEFSNVPYGTGLGYSISKAGYNSISGTIDATADVTENVTMTIVSSTTYAVSVTNGTGSGNYEVGTTVNITANDAGTGKEFDKWTGDTSVLTSTTSSSTSFTMPATTVALVASYKDIAVPTYTVTITNGTGSGEYEVGATVSIIADASSAGKEFDQWSGDISLLSSTTDSVISFTMPNKIVNLSAIYKDVIIINDVQASEVGIVYYPNPAIDIISVLTDISMVKVGIYNVIGELLMEEQADNTSIKIDLNDFNTGIYYMSIQFENDVRKTIKFIKK